MHTFYRPLYINLSLERKKEEYILSLVISIFMMARNMTNMSINFRNILGYSHMEKMYV